MSEGPVRTCPDCGQALRFPGNIGGMLMACPVCGHRFASPFTLAAASPPPLASNATFPTAASPSSPSSPKSLPNTLAARVAALYASKAR